MDTSKNKNNGSNEKELAAMSYVWIFSLLILFGKRDSQFIQHHARRGTVLFFLSLIIWALPLLRYGEFLILILCALGFITAATGNENNLPLLSEISDGTISAKNLRNYWNSLKKVFHPGAAPVIKDKEGDKEKANERVKNMQAKVEEKMEEVEERKLSTLYTRIMEDEKKIEKLEDEVKELEKKNK